jgi:hypothetical protein
VRGRCFNVFEDANMLDVKKLLFTVEDNRKVFLHLGPVGIEVCETPEEFEDFQDELVRQLNAIQDELKEYFD